MIKLRSWQEYSLLGVLSLALLALAYGPDRAASIWLIGFAALAFLSYMLLANSMIAWRRIFLVGILIRGALLWAPVGWTDDHFRYVFDGGINYFELDEVYDITPESAAAGLNRLGTEFTPLVNHANTYTVYPPFAQLIFSMSYGLGSQNDLYTKGQSDIDGVIFWMRVFILLLETLTIAALLKLLLLMGLPRSWIAWYALNPLVIMEFAANVHTEVYMITWSVLALLSLKQKNWLVSAVLLGIAASAKLWPLMFLAFVPAWVGWRKAVPFGLVAAATFIISWVPFYSESLISNVSSSLELYFRFFEFNASIYYLLKSGLPEGWVKGSSMLSILTVLFIVSLGLIAWKRKWKNAAEGMMWAMAIYLALASTVHPWYVIPLLAFGTITHYRWPFIWSALLIPTYLTYGQIPYLQPFWWIWIEYIVLAGVIALELMVHSHWAMKQRAAIKYKKLKHMIDNGARVLDIGTGNGALANAFIAEGVNVTSVDIVNRSRFENVNPQLITSGKLPFAENEFEVVFLITVLHHTTDHEEILEEARRVGKELILMEDVYSSGFQRFLTFVFDSLINLEFWGHPHSNRSDEAWQSLLLKKGFVIKERIPMRTLGVFDQVIYHAR